MSDLSSTLARVQRMRQGQASVPLSAGYAPGPAAAVHHKRHVSISISLVIIAALLIAGAGYTLWRLAATGGEAFPPTKSAGVSGVASVSAANVHPAMATATVSSPGVATVETMENITPEMYQRVNSIPLQGFVQGERMRVLIGSKTYRMGDVLDTHPEIRVYDIRAPFVVFEVGGHRIEKRF